MEKTTRQIEREKVSSASPGTGSIPDKLYFRIGEVKNITGVEPHVLRYWESEFKVIRPQRASSKQRLYRRVDVENILAIKKLLYEDGYTVPGARKLLAEKQGEGTAEAEPKIGPGRTRSMLAEIKHGLQQLQEMLEKK